MKNNELMNLKNGVCSSYFPEFEPTGAMVTKDEHESEDVGIVMYW